MAAITICSDFGAPKVKSASVSTVSPSICHEMMGPDAMILVFWMLRVCFFFLLFLNLFIYLFILLYNTVLILPYINIYLPQVYMCSLSWTPSLLPTCTIPLGHPSAPAPSILHPALNLHWQFVSYMILYMFQCHSLKSSHPLTLPQSPKDCSIHLCLFFCLTYKVIVTIFLNSIYMR